jgi:hypothetical protein
MNFTPRSENECRTLLPAAIYDVEILSAVDKISKSGNEMIEVKVGVWEGDRIRCHLYDYLLEGMPAKLRHCCDSFGILDLYQSGQLSSVKLHGKVGKAKIGIQKSKDDAYPDKNIVVDYVCRKPLPLKGEVISDGETPPPYSDEYSLPF